MNGDPAKRAVLIAGPTASGKSRLALEVAEREQGVIINADSMQVYDVLRVLTARPGPDELARAPHSLYGEISPATRFSTGDWLRRVRELVADEGKRTPIFVGGTGLYFAALEHGMAEVPEVPPAVVARVEAEVRALDAAGRAALIAERDPLMAARLAMPDPQRVVRALAVLAATGKSLAEFYGAGQGAMLDGYAVERLALDPPRDLLAARIARRFEDMLEGGAVEEVEALRGLDLDPNLPAMKGIGVREISAWLDGRISRERAIELAVFATRQYAKRQRTWLRNRMGDWPRAGP